MANTAPDTAPTLTERAAALAVVAEVAPNSPKALRAVAEFAAAAAAELAAVRAMLDEAAAFTECLIASPELAGELADLMRRALAQAIHPDDNPATGAEG